MTPQSQPMTLAELTEAADVSTRTVRYYIAEGLLPPPEGAGAASVYTAGHLARLRLIAHLKAAYWPLKEIRRYLAGLSDDDVAGMLAESGGADRLPQVDAAMAPARDYLALMEQRATYHTTPLPLPAAPAAPAPRSAGLPQPPTGPDPRGPDSDAGSLWRRIALGEEAELVISERAYTRHRERIDWLIRWARKVFS